MDLPDRGDLGAFFEPGSVAVLGSLREMMGTAYWLIKNLRQFGYAGAVYPVNPSFSGEVLGSKVYPSINETPGPVDLAVLLTPPAATPDTVEQCARKGVKAAIVISEGFAESGEEGAELQRQLTEISVRTGIRIMGPNTFGTVNPSSSLATISPWLDHPNIKTGGIAFCSQTGSVGPHQMPIVDWDYPISKMCDLGNKCDVDESDMLSYLANDEATRVVAMHLEDIRDGRRFMEAARRLTASKPLVILKSGRTDAGARASASHTGSLMGNDKVYDAAFRQVGAIRVSTWQELWEVPKTLAYQPLPEGNRFAIVTFTGGQGVIATDAAANAGLEMAQLSEDTVGKLKEVSPRLGNNPVDVGPAMSDSRSQSARNPFEALEKAIELTLNDANVDCATITFSTGRQVVPLYPMVVDMIVKSVKGCGKTVNVWVYGTDLASMEELARRLHSHEVPAYLDLDMAVKSLGDAVYYSGKTGTSSIHRHHPQSDI
ncbi:MAG: acetate--CoA ligase family protein [Dehalococcoidia bacterium]